LSRVVLKRIVKRKEVGKVVPVTSRTFVMAAISLDDLPDEEVA